MNKPSAKEKFKDAIGKTLKTFAEEQNLTVSFGDQNSSEVQGDNIVLPSPSSKLNRTERNIIRGHSDRLGFYRKFHRDQLTTIADQLNGQSKLIYQAMELARISALGAMQFAGAGQNLSTLLENELDLMVDSHHPDQLLGHAAGCLVYDHLLDQDYLSDQLQHQLSPWRPRIENALAHFGHDLKDAQHDQSAFARICVDFIKALQIQLPFDCAEGDDFPEMDQSIADDQAASMESLNSEQSDEADAAAFDTDAVEGVDDEQTLSVELAEEAGEGIEGTQSPSTEVNDAPAYTIYTTEFDEVALADQLCTLPELLNLRKVLDKELLQFNDDIARLANQLHRFLMAKQQRAWQFDLEEGVLDSSRLSQVVANPNAVLAYKQEVEMAYRDTVVTLLIDCSGSMRGRSIKVAAMCADIISRTLERCAVKVEILGFTTSAWNGGKSRELWLAQGQPPQPGRLNDIRHIIFKSADSLWRRSRLNMGLMLRESLLKENIDGEALRWAYQRLLKRNEQRRLLMVISDGMPVDNSTLSANANQFLENDLRDVIADIEQNKAVELLAIGIGHDVTQYYDQAIMIMDVDDLCATMTDQLIYLFSKTRVS